MEIYFTNSSKGNCTSHDTEKIGVLQCMPRVSSVLTENNYKIYIYLFLNFKIIKHIRKQTLDGQLHRYGFHQKPKDEYSEWLSFIFFFLLKREVHFCRQIVTTYPILAYTC